MAYMPHTPEDVQEMLASIGAKSVDDMFRDVPADLMLKKPVNIPSMDEYELFRYFEERAAKNQTVAPGRLFLGCGAYQHFIPAAVKNLISRGEVMTCYTPYQAEVSQGTLQAIFEFQSHVCALTGMEVANASMYDGATALAEACTMASRTTKSKLILIPETVHPNYVKVVRTFMRELNIDVRLIPTKDGHADYESLMAEAPKAAAVIVQTPNFFGVLEETSAARALAQKCQALLVGVCNPTALAIIAPPGEWGADIAVGEAQPVGIPLQYGGPYAGYFATQNKHMRQMPGRIVGKTLDTRGNEGFVLTLQTREQHIRREKATSNICTNQGLFALMATMYLTFVGKNGLVEIAETCASRLQELVGKLGKTTDVKPMFAGAPCFHECALELPIPAEEFLHRMMEDHGIVAGFKLQRFFPDMENGLLVCATEMNSSADIDAYVAAAKNVLARELVS